MLPKKNKLNLSDLQTKSLFEDGLTWKGSYFHVRFDFQADIFKMNVTVPKKNIFFATQRNVWKRFLYQFFTKKTNFPVRLRFRVISNVRLTTEVQTNVTQELEQFFDFIQKKNPSRK